MARIIATPVRPYTTPCDSPQQPCPDCGGLECLCRPRFFAGQMLTDEDLNRLNHYIVEKNKLHNRYLHGWGVVCGLEVVCDPCSGVVVNPGYALSPCGEDIIVCKNQSVDVCSLINACRRPKNNCDPLDAFSPNDNCLDTTEQWVLAIRYHETPTRNITSLKGASGSSCCSSCACGGSSSCGCGGSQSTSTSSSSEGCGCSTKSSTSTRSSKSAPPQCEPTVICEGFVFEVCKMPANAAVPIGALVERMQCCLKLLIAAVVLPPSPATPQALQNWCCQLRENFADLFAAHPGHACQLTAQLGNLCQDAANSTAADIVGNATVYLYQFLLDCVCSALLPPCPAPVTDDRLYLATITIRRRDCQIIEICNWDQRKFVVTFPMLAYWLSPLQLGAKIKRAIAKLCCNPLQQNPVIAGVNRDQALKFQTTPYPATVEQRSAVLSRVLAQSFAAPGAVGADTLVLAEMGAVSDKQGPLLSDEQMQMPMETLLLDQLVQPLVAQLAGLAGLGGVATGGNAGSSDIADLRTQMATMNDTLNEQAKTIADLSAKLNK